MALSALTKRALEISLAQHGAGSELHVAVDANTLKTSRNTAAAITLTTSNATTSWLKNKMQTLKSSLYVAGHMAT